MVDGRVFHKNGATLLNARAPHGVVVFGSISKWAPADLSDRVGTYSKATPLSATMKHIDYQVDYCQMYLYI